MYVCLKIVFSDLTQHFLQLILVIIYSSIICFRCFVDLSLFSYHKFVAMYLCGRNWQYLLNWFSIKELTFRNRSYFNIFLNPPKCSHWSECQFSPAFTLASSSCNLSHQILQYSKNLFQKRFRELQRKREVKETSIYKYTTRLYILAVVSCN